MLAVASILAPNLEEGINGLDRTCRGSDLKAQLAEVLLQMLGQAVESFRQHSRFAEALLVAPLERGHVAEVFVLAAAQMVREKGGERTTHVIQIAGPGRIGALVGSRHLIEPVNAAQAHERRKGGPHGLLEANDSVVSVNLQSLIDAQAVRDDPWPLAGVGVTEGITQEVAL